MKKINYLKFNYDAYARTCAADDFLRQTRRTVNGVPVSDEQIQMILNAISSALDIQKTDELLDIACGNGALSHFLFDSCSGYLGVDVSEYLISVSKKNFETLPNYRFAEQGAVQYVRTEPYPESYSKVLCYGSFQYFPAADAIEVLRTLHQKFSNVQAIFIGNLPDRERAAEFYKRPPDTEELADCHSQMGIWRSRSEFAELVENSGWTVKFSVMPAGFHAANYRYDVLLSR